VDLAGWGGSPSDRSFQRLLKGLIRILGDPPAKSEAPTKQPATKQVATKKPAPRARAPKQSKSAEDERLNPRILIEGGEFLMGEGSDSHRVRVSPFYMQQHQVTNEEYRRFSSAHKFENGQERYPVVRVTWQEAKSYAEWLGGSLPTEAQWESAARGTEGRKYPWGKEKPTCERANFRDCGRKLKAVGSHPDGATPEGVEDLAGNVWEWCSDWFGDYPPDGGEVPLDPTGPSSGSARVLRGGSILVTPRALRGADRGRNAPVFSIRSVGFRVVWSAAGGLD
jgi:serine/threonine-protein kinase